MYDANDLMKQKNVPDLTKMDQELKQVLDHMEEKFFNTESKIWNVSMVKTNEFISFREFHKLINSSTFEAIKYSEELRSFYNDIPKILRFFLEHFKMFIVRDIEERRQIRDALSIEEKTRKIYEAEVVELEKKLDMKEANIKDLKHELELKEQAIQYLKELKKVSDQRVPEKPVADSKPDVALQEEDDDDDDDDEEMVESEIDPRKISRPPSKGLMEEVPDRFG